MTGAFATCVEPWTVQGKTRVGGSGPRRLGWRGLRVGLAALLLPLLADETLAQDNKEPRTDPTGTWRWVYATENGQKVAASVKLHLEGDKLEGTAKGPDGLPVPIEEARFAGSEVSFAVTRTVKGHKFTTRYEGTISGETLRGKMSMGPEGSRRTSDWEARRLKEAAVVSPAGTWSWFVKDREKGRVESILKLTVEGEKLAAVLVWGRGPGAEAASGGGTFKAGEVSFTVTQDRDGKRLTARYAGKFSGDRLDGTVESDWGGESRRFEWHARRVLE